MMVAPKPLPIVVLISGTGSNLQAIIDAIQAGQLHAKIRAVISNRPGVTGLQRAAVAGIPTHVINHAEHHSRHDFDQALQACIDQYQPRLVVLAGFMRILGDDLVRHYLGRMVNIHPSLLPEFPGLDTHQKVLAAGHKQHGASVHFVTPELDGGPLLIQAVVPVQPGDTAESLQQKVHQQEHIIYPMAIEWIAEGQVQYANNKILFNGKPLEKPHQVTASQTR